MSKSTDALSAFLANWEELKKSRPTEGDFSSYGHALSYDSMDELFTRWRSTLSILDKKGYWSTSPEVGIADAPLAAMINDLSGFAVNAVGHGVAWLLSGVFLGVAHNVQQQLSALAGRQADINRETAKLLAERSAGDIDEILSAAKSARKVISLGKESAENAQRIVDATSAIEAAKILAESTNARLATIATESDLSAKSTAESKLVVAQAHAEVADLHTAAAKRDLKLDQRAHLVDARLSETEAAAAAALKSVEQALRKVRDQGLAHSFQARSTDLQSERRLWTLVFVGSAVALLVIAIIFATELSTVSYEALLVHLTRKAALAAPLIWIGWYSARQVGRISRVQEDYEYKAASALAFQSYKEEAKLGSDPALEKQLLELAIRTFGENPVRLYDSHTNDPVSPLQAAIKELPPEKIVAILAAIGDQSLKAKFWPFAK